jgi:pre-rRNA-processing protein IPI3
MIVAVLVASSKDDSVYVIDPTSGTQLALLKNCTSDVGGVALITRSFPGSSGDFVVAAQRDRMLLHFWSWQKEQPVLKCHTPEKIGPLAVTHNGAFCFGGGKSGKIYIWEVVFNSS